MEDIEEHLLCLSSNPEDFPKLPDVIVNERKSLWENLFTKYEDSEANPSDDPGLSFAELNTYSEARVTAIGAKIHRSKQYQEYLAAQSELAEEVATQYGNMEPGSDEEELGDEDEEESDDSEENMLLLLSEKENRQLTCRLDYSPASPATPFTTSDITNVIPFRRQTSPTNHVSVSPRLSRRTSQNCMSPMEQSRYHDPTSGHISPSRLSSCQQLTTGHNSPSKLSSCKQMTSSRVSSSRPSSCQQLTASLVSPPKPSRTYHSTNHQVSPTKLHRVNELTSCHVTHMPEMRHLSSPSSPRSVSLPNSSQKHLSLSNQGHNQRCSSNINSTTNVYPATTNNRTLGSSSKAPRKLFSSNSQRSPQKQTVGELTAAPSCSSTRTARTAPPAVPSNKLVSSRRQSPHIHLGANHSPTTFSHSDSRSAYPGEWSTSDSSPDNLLCPTRDYSPNTRTFVYLSNAPFSPSAIPQPSPATRQMSPAAQYRRSPSTYSVVSPASRRGSPPVVRMSAHLSSPVSHCMSPTARQLSPAARVVSPSAACRHSPSCQRSPCSSQTFSPREGKLSVLSPRVWKTSQTLSHRELTDSDGSDNTGHPAVQEDTHHQHVTHLSHNYLHRHSDTTASNRRRHVRQSPQLANRINTRDQPPLRELGGGRGDSIDNDADVDDSEDNGSEEDDVEDEDCCVEEGEGTVESEGEGGTEEVEDVVESGGEEEFRFCSLCLKESDIPSHLELPREIDPKRDIFLCDDCLLIHWGHEDCVDDACKVCKKIGAIILARKYFLNLHHQELQQ